MRSTTIIKFLVLIGVACQSVTARGQAASRPVDSQRVVQLFDFEERRLGNDEDAPMYWQKLAGADYPHYVSGRMTNDRHRSGSHSFRMDLDGGNCIYRYEPGRIKVQPGARYRLEGYCQTTALQHARARLTCYLTDVDLHPIDGTVRHSELFSGSGDDSDWHQLFVEMTAEPAQSAFLVIQMELVQPSQFSTSSLGKRSLFLQDVHGTAWFDDLCVSQVPQLKMTTGRPLNVFAKSDPLLINVEVNDRSADDLTVQLLVSDALGRRVYQRTGDSVITSAQTISPGLRRLTLALPAVDPGWYRASLRMVSHGLYVGEQTLDWIRLGDDVPAVAPDPRFGMIATELPMECWSELPRILPILAAGRVKLAVWSKDGDIQQADAAIIDPLLAGLSQQGISTTGCLTGLPPKLGESLNGGGFLQLLTAKDDDWQNQLSFLISRHANQLDRWQLGSDGTDDFANSPDLRKVFTKVLSKYTALLDKPDLSMPYPIWFETPVPAPVSLSLSVATAINPEEIPTYLQEFKGRDAQALSVSLAPLELDRYGRDAQIRDVVQRFIYSLAGGSPRVDLPLPMEVRHQSDHVSAEPSELLLIYRTLLTNLAGATFRGKLPLSDDIDAYLFDKAGQGVLVMWNHNDVVDSQPLAVNLGERPRQIDLWGNASLLLGSGLNVDDSGRKTSRPGNGLVLLKVGRMPIILTGVDSEMGQLRASVCLDQPLIESTYVPHNRKLKFSNPYNQPIGGVLRLRGPLGWSLNPPSFSFTLNPGETFEKDVAIEIPYNSIAGKNTLMTEFNLQADRNSKFSVPIAMTLGLTDVGTRCLAFRDGKDVVVQQMITNYGDKPITYSAFAAYPGRPRIERLVTSLAAGRTTIKKYRFIAAAADKSTKIRVGLKESEGTRILNDEVQLR